LSQRKIFDFGQRFVLMLSQTLASKEESKNLVRDEILT